MANDTDTIFALSSGAGRSGVAVYRISGPDAHPVLKQLTGNLSPVGQVRLCSVSNPMNGALIDRGLVFRFAAPRSFTGEDMAELQLHGSFAVQSDLEGVLGALGCRPAEAGEFTLRAFRNGKMDLVQAEALADLIDAETIAQKKQALAASEGRLSTVAAAWREALVRSLAVIEAAIDFPEEEDVPARIEERARPILQGLIGELSDYLAQSQNARRLREGISVALVGPPNAGKSSLLNWLVKSDRAIVSAIPGTTRDFLEARIELAGVPVTLIDTAGLRDDAADEVEAEGIRRARKKIRTADWRIGVIDGADARAKKNLADLLGEVDEIVLTKHDLGQAVQLDGRCEKKITGLSVKTATGTEAFLAGLEKKIQSLAGVDGEVSLFRERQVRLVEAAVSHLKRSLQMLAVQPELAAEDVRLAARRLAELTGEVNAEAVLGDIFSSFCIGK